VRRGTPSRTKALLTLPLLAIAGAGLAQAQEAPAAAPRRLQLLTDFDIHLSIEQVGSDDSKFVWDADYGADLDLLDYGLGRVTFLAEYEAILGEELRRFDPNQGNYTLDISSSVRTDAAEVAFVFHHLSRHLSDRRKTFPIDWNMVGVHAIRPVTIGSTWLELRGRALWNVKRSFVDYRADYGAGVQVRHRVDSHVSVIGAGELTLMPVDRAVLDRPTQVGARLEAGVRLDGPGAAAELFVAYERRIDAGPFDVRPRTWGLVGLRLLSR